MDQKEAELFKAFTESDNGLRIFLKQAIAISDDMMSKSTDAESKMAWLEMSIASRKLDLAACERMIKSCPLDSASWGKCKDITNSFS